MDDPDLLYEDLFEDLEDGKTIIKTSLHEMEDAMKSLRNEAEQLRLQVRNLQEQNKELSKQNEVLIRNISCLFKTAQMEISRKDKKIRSLHEESLKMNASNSGSPASTSAQAVADRVKPYLVASQSDHRGNTGETCAPSGGISNRSIHGGRHGEYRPMVSRGVSKDKMGETPSLSAGIGEQAHNGEYSATESPKDSNDKKAETVFAPEGTWKQGHLTHCDHVAVASQSDCKFGMEKVPSGSDSLRRRAHHRNGHCDYATMASQAIHTDRMDEMPAGGSEKQSHYEHEHRDYSIKTSQLDCNSSKEATPLDSDGTRKQGHYGKSADLEPQGDCKGRVKEFLPESGGTAKPGHHNANTIISQADYRKRERENLSTSSGMERQDHQRVDHGGYSEKSRSCGKDGEQQDETWKRRRSEGEFVAAEHEYHRKRAKERYPFDSKRGEGSINTPRCFDVHKASERRREKWSRS